MNVVAPYLSGIARTLHDSVAGNPVVVKELRTRMRGWRTFLLMGGYNILLAIVALITYAAVSAAARYQYGGGVANQRIGLQLFGSLSWTQSILLLLVIPALVSRSLTGELESKTIELLVLTRLSAGRIVVGKLLSGFLYSMILVLCSLPIAGICVMLGGISPMEVTTSYALLAAWAFLLASVSVFWSALFNRTMVSSLFSYATGGLYMLITSSVIAGFTFGGMRGGSNSVPAFSALSPGWVSYFISQNSVVCGLRIPVALVAFAFHVALGVLLLLTATMHVRYKKADRALSVRLLCIGITAAMYWVILGDKSLMWSGAPNLSDVRDALGMALFTVIPFLGLGLPIFATGPIRKQEYSPRTYGLRLSKVLRGDLGGSILFMMLWAAVLCAVIMITMAWSSAAYHMPALSYLKSSLGAQYAPIWASAWHSWLALSFVAVTVIAGLSAIGILASSISRRRSEAAAITIFAWVACLGLYWAVLASYLPSVSNPHNPIWQLAALWPPTAFRAITGGWPVRSMPPLYWDYDVSWAVVGTAYVVITALALGATSLLAKRLPGIQED
jgi:ABC-type transport system involved in multi-copper enzyme maturation permease subunit